MLQEGAFEVARCDHEPNIARPICGLSNTLGSTSQFFRHCRVPDLLQRERFFWVDIVHQAIEIDCELFAQECRAIFSSQFA